MGKQSRRKRARRQQRAGLSSQPIDCVRRWWLNKAVWFDAGRGHGRQLGKVTSISNYGDVLVEALTDEGVAGLAFSLGYVGGQVERVLALVTE